LRDLLAVVFRQRRLALFSFVAVFFAVVLYGLIAPPYQSEMKVLVRRGGVDPVVTPGAIVPLRAHRCGGAALPDQLVRFHSPGPGRKCARRQPLPQPTTNRSRGCNGRIHCRPTVSRT